jgi:hypothetical protein
MEKLQQSGQRISATQGQPNHPSGRIILSNIIFDLDCFSGIDFKGLLRFEE